MEANRNKLAKIIRKYIFSLLVIFIMFFSTSSINLKSGAYQFTHDELSIPIITYHKFCQGESTDEYTINLGHLKQHMDYLKKNDNRVITVDQILECIANNFFPDKPVVITVDERDNSV